jgi:hypothetical protein
MKKQIPEPIQERKKSPQMLVWHGMSDGPLCECEAKMSFWPPILTIELLQTLILYTLTTELYIRPEEEKKEEK